MDTESHQNKREKLADKKEEEEGKEGLSRKNQRPTTTTTNTNPTTSPPSSTSSPSHEFSFTISLHPSTTTTTTTEKCKPPPSFAIDLSPADDIFLHGQLLPLHLSHSSISPRTSTTSLDSLNFPIRSFADNQKPTTITTTTTTTGKDSLNNKNNTSGINGRSKSKSFSLFGLAKWRKTIEIKEREERKKVRLDIHRFVRQYARVVRDVLFFKRGEKEKGELRRQPHSFSGNLNSRCKEWGGRRGGNFSAPASMWTSPTNSGLLLTTASISSSNDSTMEELQSAIQAAIAHCKNSIADQEDKFKC